MVRGLARGPERYGRLQRRRGRQRRRRRPRRQDLDAVERDAVRVAEGLEEHEAEEWPRRVVRNEVRRREGLGEGNVPGARTYAIDDEGKAR